MPAVALLDASVLYPIVLTDTLLRAAERELLRPRWSARILEEAHRALVQSRPKREEAVRWRIEQMKQAFPEALVEGWEALEGRMRNHPKDRHVLAAAVRCNADVLVTKNLRHFPSESCEPYGIEPISPDDLLRELAAGEPREMAEVIEEQAAAYSNPRWRAEDVLNALARDAPMFSREIRAVLGLRPA